MKANKKTYINIANLSTFLYYYSQPELKPEKRREKKCEL